MLTSAKEHWRFSAADLHVKLRQAAAQQAQAGHPVGELAGARLERAVYVVDDVGVQADAGHEQEMPRNAAAVARQMAHGNAPRAALLQARGGTLDPGSELHLLGQHVGGAAGENGQGHAGVHHAFGHFIDGAVAAGGHNQVGAAGDVLARNGARGSRPVVGATVRLWPLFRRISATRPTSESPFRPNLPA